MSRVPSADKLRPGSRTKSRVTITHSQSTNRLQTPQTNIRRDSSSYLLPSNHNNDHPIQRAQTAKIN